MVADLLEMQVVLVDLVVVLLAVQQQEEQPLQLVREMLVEILRMVVETKLVVAAVDLVKLVLIRQDLLLVEKEEMEQHHLFLEQQ